MTRKRPVHAVTEIQQRFSIAVPRDPVVCYQCSNEYPITLLCYGDAIVCPHLTELGDKDEARTKVSFVEVFRQYEYAKKNGHSSDYVNALAYVLGEKRVRGDDRDGGANS